MAELYNLKQRQERRPPMQIMGADGAIDIRDGAVLITKASAAAVTLAAPVAGKDDGKTLIVVSTTAQAHTLTITGGLNGAGAAADVGTFGLAVGNGIALVAYNGTWYNLPGTNQGVTFA